MVALPIFPGNMQLHDSNNQRFIAQGAQPRIHWHGFTTFTYENAHTPSIYRVIHRLL